MTDGGRHSNNRINRNNTRKEEDNMAQGEIDREREREIGVSQIMLIVPRMPQSSV
jgi:hypothetical protein